MFRNVHCPLNSTNNNINYHFIYIQKQLTSYEIYSAVQKFGAVDRVFDDPATFTFSMAHTDSVNALIPNRVLSVKNVNFTVEFVRKQVIRLEFPPNSINTLPIECVHKIFTYLDESSLCSAQMVCKRFYDAANDIVRNRYRGQTPINFDSLIDMAMDTTTHPLWRSEEFFINFGDLVDWPFINNDTHRSRIIFDLVARNCKKIKVVVCDITGNTPEWHQNNPLLATDSNLKMLQIKGNGTNTSLPQSNMSNLQVLVLQDVHIKKDPSTFEFFRSNSQLYTLKLHCNGSLTTDSFPPLCQLVNLVECTLADESVHIAIKFVDMIGKTNSPIERFTLCGIKYETRGKELFDVMGQCLPQLQELTILDADDSSVTPTDICNALRHLTDMKTVHISNRLPKLSKSFAKVDDLWMDVFGDSII